MSGDLRTVRHLRLRAADAAQARHAQVLLEDALRCASLPDAPGRLLLVRRLALGRLAAQASPQSVALRVEQRLAALSASPRHGGADGAADGAAVWFRDALDAHTVLGLRLAAGAAPADWFWPLAVSGYDAGRGAAAGLRQVLASLASRAEAPAAVPAWVRAVADAGRLAALAAALDAGELPAVRAAARLERGPGPGAPPSGSALPRARASRPAATRTDRPQAEALPPVDGADTASGRVRGFLADALQRAGRSVVPAFATMAATTASTPARGFSGAVPQRAGPPEAPETVATGSDAAAPAAVDAAGPAGAADATATMPDAAVATPVAAIASSVVAHAPADAGVALDDSFAGRPTAAGGLLLLVRALDRLGYGTWADEHRPDDPGAVARRLFGLLLGRLGVPADDPTWQLASIGSGAPAGALPGPAWQALDRRRAALGARRPLPQAPPDVPAVDAGAAAWLALARRWLRRVAAIGPATLVLRPARLALTPTHVDVNAGLQAADVRIRRAGLDVDPGWTPWLGRVVAFHYDARYDRPLRPAGPGGARSHA